MEYSILYVHMYLHFDIHLVVARKYQAIVTFYPVVLSLCHTIVTFLPAIASVYHVTMTLQCSCKFVS